MKYRLYTGWRNTVRVQLSVYDYRAFVVDKNMAGSPTRGHIPTYSHEVPVNTFRIVITQMKV